MRQTSASLPLRVNLHDNLDTVLACARPLFWKSAVPGHELYGRGTCFIVRASGAIWIATAAHCTAGKRLEDLAVPRSIPDVTAPVGDFFHPIALVGPRPQDADDTAGFDVVMIRTNETHHPHALNLEDPGFFAPLDSARRGDPVRITGFPASLDNSIDGPSGAIRVQAFHADGQYAESTTSRHLHRFTLDRVGKVDDLDGMSGAPLFYVRGGEYSFGGVVVRGDAGAKVAHFVDGRWLPLLAKGLTEEMTKKTP